MKFSKQLNSHDPDNGVWGDCYRTCLACILGKDPAEVPHFYDNGVSGDDPIDAARNWLLGQGLGIAQFVYDAQATSLLEILQCHAHLNPDQPYIVCGISKRSNVGHCVVGCGGQLVWDPSEAAEKASVEDLLPCEDGLYWLEFITMALPPNTPTAPSEGGAE